VTVHDAEVVTAASKSSYHAIWNATLRPMSHLQLYRATKSQALHAVSHTATLSHKQELTSQRSPHFRDKVKQNRALL